MSSVDGDTVAASEIVPVKPLTVETAIVDVPEVPERTGTLVGLPATAKS